MEIETLQKANEIQARIVILQGLFDWCNRKYLIEAVERGTARISIRYPIGNGNNEFLILDPGLSSISCTQLLDGYKFSLGVEIEKLQEELKNL